MACMVASVIATSDLAVSTEKSVDYMTLKESGFSFVFDGAQLKFETVTAASVIVGGACKEGSFLLCVSVGVAAVVFTFSQAIEITHNGNTEQNGNYPPVMIFMRVILIGTMILYRRVFMRL